MITLKYVGMTELRRRFYYYIRLVESGHTLIITKRGTPVAAMIPFNEWKKASRKQIRK